MKDLILITTFCPDSNRENLLTNLINSIDSTKFDILITSHTSIPKEIQDKVNYVFYDQENTLYHDMESAPYYWTKLPNESGYVFHTKLHHPLHILAILRLSRFGYQIAKMLGYKKLHHIEYDSLVLDDQIFLQNSLLLNSVDIVAYRNETFGPKHNRITNALHGSFKSINLDKLPLEIIEYDEQKIKSYFKNPIHGSLPEQYIFNLYSKLNLILKYQNELNPYLVTALHKSGTSSFEIIPYVKDNKLELYYRMIAAEKLNFKFYLNNTVYDLSLKPLEWKFHSFGPYEEVSYFKIEIEGKIYLELNLEKNNNRAIFKKRHYYSLNL